MIEYDIRAGQSVIYLLTAEEARAELEIARLGKELKRTVWTWSHTEGFYCPSLKQKDQEEDPIEALTKIKTMDNRSIFIFRDLHTFFKGGGAQKVLRLIRDISRDFKQSGKTLIILSPTKEIPAEIERDIIVEEFDLPNEKMIATIFDGLYDGAKEEIGKIEPDEREKIIQGASGLTSIEAETAISKAIVIQVRGKKAKKETKSISALVLKEKAMEVKKSGVLQYFEAKETAENIGGLDMLKKWLNIRGKVFSKGAREFGLPNPKGILLLGLPGCGKSLTAKAASNILKIPLVRFDISAVFGGLVGMSEANTRNALKTIDAIGPCVVWIDEIEKAMSGMGGGGGGGGDSGTSTRVFGQIITWMQEKTSPGFLVATANNIDSLPPELLRKGRWDEIFFIGLPTEKERREILDICVRQCNRDPFEMDQKIMNQCAEDSVEFSGAELAAAINDALYYAFYKGEELNADFIWGAVKRTNPLAKSRKKQLASMRQWASENAMNASSVSEEGGEKFRRAMEL